MREAKYSPQSWKMLQELSSARAEMDTGHGVKMCWRRAGDTLEPSESGLCSSLILSPTMM